MEASEGQKKVWLPRMSQVLLNTVSKIQPVAGKLQIQSFVPYFSQVPLDNNCAVE